MMNTLRQIGKQMKTNKEIIAKWNNLNLFEKTTYNILGKRRKISGIEVFIKENRDKETTINVSDTRKVPIYLHGRLLLSLNTYQINANSN